MTFIGVYLGQTAKGEKILKKKALLFLIFIPLIVLSGCGGESDFLIYEVEFGQKTLFIYPHFYMRRESDFVVRAAGGKGVYHAGDEISCQIKGEEQPFSDFLQGLPDYKFKQRTDGKEYIYLYNNGEYLAVNCAGGYDKQNDRSLYYIRQSMVYFTTGKIQLNPVFITFTIAEFIFPISETAIFDIQEFNKAGQNVALDFDFLLLFYVLMPDAKIDAGNKNIKVLTLSHKSFVTLALQPDGMTRISFTEGVTD